MGAREVKKASHFFNYAQFPNHRQPQRFDNLLERHHLPPSVLACPAQLRDLIRMIQLSFRRHPN
jgi:hypothetical protein